MCGIAVVVRGASSSQDGGCDDVSADGTTAPEVASCHNAVKKTLGRRGPDGTGTHSVQLTGGVHLMLYGAELQLRGQSPITQPLLAQNGNVLCFNGEIFGGADISPAENDGARLLGLLQAACCCSADLSQPLDGTLNLKRTDGAACYSEPEEGGCGKNLERNGCQFGRPSVPEVLSRLRGPWAVIYWQAATKTLYYGRDVMGRRSLVAQWPTQLSDSLVISSAPIPFHQPAIVSTEEENALSEAHKAEAGVLNTANGLFKSWEDVPCGVYSLAFSHPLGGGGFVGSLAQAVCKHDWKDPTLLRLQAWQRAVIEPTSSAESAPTSAADVILEALSTAVRKRVSDIRERPEDSLPLGGSKPRGGGSSEPPAQVGVLFSGGLDSMLLAALADRHVAQAQPLDLINVCFDGGASPDRLSALAGLEELRRLNPKRRWRLICVNSSLTEVDTYRPHILAVICPSATYMDLNIGAALWLASRGEGWLAPEPPAGCSETPPPGGGGCYRSVARVLLVGSGADEQCAGYGRHRTRFRAGGWQALDAEMRLDVKRLWQRNLGRDDRCIADWGREARFPFLDEGVMENLLGLPLAEVADLRRPLGEGDKLVLRQVARMLGIEGAAALPKRAIQFGSRIARASNRRDFGSNNAANLASAGTVVLPDLRM